VFEGIEVWAVSREIFKGMPGAGDGILGILSFVEGGVVHHHHASGGELGQEILLDPGGENVRIDIDAEQPDRQQTAAEQRADHIGTASSVPVVRAMTSLPLGRIAMGARHVVREAAFVDVNDGAPCRLISGDLILEDAPCVLVCLGMPQSFFYRSRPNAAARDRSLSD
jgi:hypothetical protein